MWWKRKSREKDKELERKRRRKRRRKRSSELVAGTTEDKWIKGRKREGRLT